MTKAHRRSGGGDCFEVALDLGIGLHDGELELEEGETLHIVHGLPLGTGPENYGQRFWHAWVEVTKVVDLPGPDDQTWKVELREVVDRSNGHDVRMPAEVYYHFARLRPEEHLWRFTPDEARKNALIYGHMGPWVEDESLGLLGTGED